MAFVDNLVRVFRLVRECMADHATCWLNIGDSYGDDTKWGGATGGKHVTGLHGKTNIGRQQTSSGVAPGNLCLIPQRLAIALQDDGWLVRSVVVWHKPAPMPQSISGWSWRRCRVKTKAQGKPSRAAGSNGEWLGGPEWVNCPGCPKCEKNNGYVLRRGSWRPTSSWEPILMLAKTDRYFCDAEAVRQPPSLATVNRNKYTRILDDPDEQFAVRHDHETLCDGANPRDVWTISAEPLRFSHYAAYPTELVFRCLSAGTSSRGYCPACGSPWTRVIEAADGWGTGPGAHGSIHKGGAETGEPGKPVMANKTVGWKPSCLCSGAEIMTTRPGLVLDPFCGSGRTGVQAGRMGLDFVGTELNPEYCAMAERILGDAMPLFS